MVNFTILKKKYMGKIVRVKFKGFVQDHTNN